jgi:methionyl-tRNA formyltransferase
MKVILLTTRIYAPGVILLCNALKSTGISIEEIVCARNPIENQYKHLAANNILIRQAKSRIKSSNFHQNYDNRLTNLKACGIRLRFFIEPFHSQKVIEYLSNIFPDILVHVNGPIFRQPTIETARLGLINCHMGLLPEFRGMNVAEWSVLHGYPTGNTVHFINTKIDTGNILQFFQVPVKDCSTIEEMRDKLISLQYEQTAKVIKMLQEKKLSPIPQLPTQGRQYFRMHPELKAKVEQILSQGYQPKVIVEKRPYVT